MSRKRTATAEAPAQEPTAESSAPLVSFPPSETDLNPAEAQKPHIANPSSRPRPHNFANSVKKLPGTLGIRAGDLVVELVDFGNAGGVGIRVIPNEGRMLTDEEKNIIRTHVKGEEGHPSGFSWQGKDKLWHKPIRRDGERLEDIPRARPVAIRLDAESRVEKLADALKQHAADPVGYAEQIKQQREQAAQSQHIPD